MWWPIGWRCGGFGSLLDMWWLMAGDVMAHCWRCGGSLLEMWWLMLEMWWPIAGDEVAHCWRCDGSGSLLEMWWLIAGDVVDHCWKCDGSMAEQKVTHWFGNRLALYCL